nr:MAG TPA: hypothetical protein [Caudoviricetes sp.]
MGKKTGLNPARDTRTRAHRYKRRSACRGADVRPWGAGAPPRRKQIAPAAGRVRQDHRTGQRRATASRNVNRARGSLGGAEHARGILLGSFRAPEHGQ